MAPSSAPPKLADLKVGQTIETKFGRRGLVHYIGEIHVTDGTWLGLELPTPDGKNDGSVRGERYFQCPPNHGLFAKLADVAKIISQPVPKVAPKPTAAASKAAAPPRPASQAKAPVKPRTSLQPTVKPRPSSIGASKPAPKPAATTTQPKRLSVATTSSIAGFKAPARKSSVASSASSTAPGHQTLSRTQSSATKPPASTSTPSTARVARDHNVDALETRIRHLEKQHEDDNERLKIFEQVKGERNHLQGILEKIQPKLRTQHDEIGDLKSTVKRLEAEIDHKSKAEQEHETDLEIALLDKEMAEERAEQAESEIELIRARMEEQELELEILRSEAELFKADMSEEEKQAAGYYKLQIERDRMREALLRLRDITEQMEHDYKSRIQELETDLSQFDGVTEVKAELEQQVISLEANVENLRQQLDAANEWEELIEDLSGQNQQFKDQIAEKDIVIQDLESLKELNDELEVQHIEENNELRAELEARDLELAERLRNETQQATTITEQNLMLEKFRDLVYDLNSKMSETQAMQSMSEDQTKDATAKINEVMELNRQLKNANTASIIKTITSELQALQAEEAQEELTIVKHYLPDAADSYSNDALKAYFRAKRIHFKAFLLFTLMQSFELQLSITEDNDQSSTIFLRIGIVFHLQRIGINSKQLFAVIASSTLTQFAAFGPLYDELATVEQTLERVIEALKKDDIDYKDHLESLRRCSGLMKDVANERSTGTTAIPEVEIIGRVSSIKTAFEYLRDTFDAFGATLSSLEANDEEESQLHSIIKRIVEPLGVYTQSVTAAEKLLRTLNTLREDSLYPQFPEGIDEITFYDDLLNRATRATENFGTELGNLLATYANPEADQMDLFELAQRLGSLQDQQYTTGELSATFDTIIKLKSWNEHASVLMNNIEIDPRPAPWVAKAEQVQAAKRQAAETERKLQTLIVEHKAIALQIHEREEIIATKDLEVEHLKAKHREATSKVEELDHLRTQLESAGKEQRRLQEILKTQQVEIQRLKERPALSESAEPVETRPLTPSGAINPAAEKAAPQPNTSAAFNTFVQALSDENHWLRQRENSEMFGHNVKATLARLREQKAAEEKQQAQHKQKWAGEMLAMSLNLGTSFETPSKLSVDDDFELGTLEAKSTTVPKSSIRSNRRFKMSPIMLSPLRIPAYADLEDLSFIDLSPVAEEFTTEALEGYSEMVYEMQ